MTQSSFPLDPDTLLAKTADAKAIGSQHAAAYQSAKPYPHICIDGFLPEAVIDRVKADLVTVDEGRSERSYASAQENLKYAFNPDSLPEYSRNLFHAFNARPFILFLQEMTGIAGLIPDPYFMGAGIHRTLNGGHLDIHADFNLHSQMKVERRLNVLIYLNDEWKAEWGGSFEIWDKTMTTKAASFVPIRNRMVCFSTASDTFHGNPELVNHPNGEPRQSIALYYYTATWDHTRKSHSTLFKPRPDSKDQDNLRLEARRALVRDLLPPALYRKIGGRLNRIGL